MINKNEIVRILNTGNTSDELKENIRRELDIYRNSDFYSSIPSDYFNLYDRNDFNMLLQRTVPRTHQIFSLKSLDDLLEKDKQREKDGFPKKIRIGKILKPTKGKKGKVVVVPTTTEPKFLHDDSVTQEEENGSTGGSGEGEEGEVIGEQPIRPEEGKGEGTGAGQGEGGEHDIAQEAYDLGKILTEKFQLPNLKMKGRKRSFTRYAYDLTDKHMGFGQLLDKKATLRKIIQSNIIFGKVKEAEAPDPSELIFNPKDQIFRIMSREKDFESQAIVFFIRDYSGSMHGTPTEVITQQHLLIYSWLTYQYKNNVETRFIVHDTSAKEVENFHTYYSYQVAGGTYVYPAFELSLEIIEKEQLARDYNIYIFYGTDGDDWEDDGAYLIEAIEMNLKYTNRIGITVAKSVWTKGKTKVEENIEASGLLEKKPDLIRLDGFPAEEATEERIIEGIKQLVSENSMQWNS